MCCSPVSIAHGKALIHVRHLHIYTCLSVKKEKKKREDRPNNDKSNIHEKADTEYNSYIDDVEKLIQL